MDESNLEKYQVRSSISLFNPVRNAKHFVLIQPIASRL